MNDKLYCRKKFVTKRAKGADRTVNWLGLSTRAYFPCRKNAYKWLFTHLEDNCLPV